MGSINITRVILGGLVAGVIINIVEGVLNGVVLAQDWAEWARVNNRPEVGTNAIIGFNIWGFLIGIAAVWIYAAIRPRFGAGPNTAIKAALCVWIVGYFLASAAPYLLNIVPARLLAIGLVVGLLEVIAGTLVGAKIYHEEGAETSRAYAAGSRP